jgi:hypothetical protein
MDTIIAVDLKNSGKGFDFQTRFLENDFHLICVQTGGDMDIAADTLKSWDGRAKAMALENFSPLPNLAPDHLDQQERKITALCDFFNSPVSTGQSMHKACVKWTIGEIQKEHGDRFFNNANVTFISGMADGVIAESVIEYTDRLKFLDPVISGGIPKILSSLEDLRLYAEYVHPVTEKILSGKIAEKFFPLNTCNRHLVYNGLKQADIIVVPGYSFYENIGEFGIDALEGKIVITHTVSNDMLNFLKQRGVDMIIDTIPKMTDKIVGPGMLEAMVMIASADTDLQPLSVREIETALIKTKARPRVLLPHGREKKSWH